MRIIDLDVLIKSNDELIRDRDVRVVDDSETLIRSLVKKKIMI